MLYESNNSNADNQPPLSGLRVLDLTRLLPGPLCGQYLADMGAEVIKIEDTKMGDYVRPSLRALVNRGKRSLSIDLKHPKGREILLQLIDESDVLLESFRPGVMARLGLAHADLLKRKPKLVIGAITGFGQVGTRCAQAGHDINYQALTGILHQTGTVDEPVIPGFLLADLAGGTLSAVAGILAALFRVERGGLGGVVDVSMADALISLSALPIALNNEGQELSERGKGTHTGGTAQYHIYSTSDGKHLAVGAQEKKFWKVFCETIGLPEIIERHSHQPQDNIDLIEIISTKIKTRSLDDWMESFAGLDCCVSPVVSISDALQDQHFLSRGTVWKNGSTHAIGLPFRLSSLSEPAQKYASAPCQGEHSKEILQELGFDNDLIAGLLNDNVVKA